MFFYSDIDKIDLKNGTVLTIGTFDGVHNGHKKLISRLLNASESLKLESLVFTFKPHPRLVLFPNETDLKLLNTYEERSELFRIADIDHLLEFPFNEEFSHIDPEFFVREILCKKLKMKKMVIGYDHRFGKNRSGSIELIRNLSTELNFEVEEINAQEINEINISSTRIRKALESGNVKLANLFLGYSYFISGIVIKGKQLGREIGYPTANIGQIDELKLIPASGVYAVLVEVNGIVKSGMMSIGKNPTTDNDDKVKLEVNIFDFDEDIYDKKIKIYFIDFIRKEIKFDGIDELKLALAEDKVKTLKILKQ
ncbi:MAG: bifunctional riboflavin kinase/FAD synthetase [Bacteroidota bacterium]